MITSARYREALARVRAERDAAPPPAFDETYAERHPPRSPDITELAEFAAHVRFEMERMALPNREGEGR